MRLAARAMGWSVARRHYTNPSGRCFHITPDGKIACTEVRRYGFCDTWRKKMEDTLRRYGPLGFFYNYRHW